MGKLSILRDAIKDNLKSALPNNFDIDTHSGRFDANALALFIAKSPAIRVAIMGFKDFRTFGENADIANCQIGIYIALKDTSSRLDRDAGTLDIAEAVMLLANTNRWGLPFAFGAKPQGAQNLHSDVLVGKGVALWAIDISQDIIIQPDDLPSPIQLKTIYLGIAPQIGVGNEEFYIPIDAAPTL